MPKEFGRNRRVGDLIQRELAQLIQRESNKLRDIPGATLITVAKVDVSPDLAQAKVFVTTLDDQADRSRLLAGLNHNAGHFRHELAQLLRLRTMPKLRFVYDEAQERGIRLSRLIDSLHVVDDDSDEDSGTS